MISTVKAFRPRRGRNAEKSSRGEGVGRDGRKNGAAINANAHVSASALVRFLVAQNLIYIIGGLHARHVRHADLEPSS